MKILKNLGNNDQVIVSQILEIFREVDIKTEEFKRKTGIKCPNMCALCCKNFSVETTAIEMIPLAVKLWSENKAYYWLDKIEKIKSETCVFLKNDLNNPHNGRCKIYEFRPLICRLFGFFTTKDKNGKYVYGSCRIIKKNYPDIYKKAIELIEEGFHPSNITDFTIPIISMGYDLGKKILPINMAIKIALEKIGFSLDNKSKEQSS